MLCEGCGTELSPVRLDCPACRRLTHQRRLEELADEAERASASGRTEAALAAWREALTLLPPASRQFESISNSLSTLSQRIDRGGRAAQGPSWRAAAGTLGAVGVLAWKGKVVLLAVASKAKLLLAGLGKSGTAFSMLLSLGVYWTAFGWWFALGLVLSLYVHEIGHVAALRRYGIPASAPMFVPGIGAFVRMKQYPADAREDARVGLAGPVWGLGAAVVSYAAFLATGAPILAAIARVGAWLNLFNLLPFWQLDGGRGFRVLSRSQRIAVVVAMLIAWWATGEGLLLLLAVVGGVQAVGTGQPSDGDWRCCLEFVQLVVVLAALASVEVPGTTARP
jgi:Zn-dependent protease